jgi:outer membrane receptor protein involved in Fe transport
LASYFGRANYTLDDKYNFTAGIRRDGSSVFGENHRWGNFWNAGASWVLSREDFMRNSEVINYLKFGVSYGTNGNSEGILETEKYALFTNGSYGGNSAFLASSTNPGNADLKWEVLKGFNALVEFSLFGDRVMGNVNYYRNITEDLFISQELPRSAGGTSLTINAGSMKNEGIEVDLDFNVFRSQDWNINIGGQFSYNKNVITDLGQVDEFELGTSIVREGLALSTHYIEEWGGVNPANGNPMYVDENGNLTEDFNAVNPKATYGSSIAPWAGGVTFSANYKSFSLSALGSFVYGNVLFNNQTFLLENPNFAQFNSSNIMNSILFNSS